MRARAVLLACCLAVGCGDDEGGGSAAPFEVLDLGTASFTETVGSGPFALGATPPIRFEVPDDAVSYAVLTDFAKVVGLGLFLDLTTPSGTNLTPGGSLAGYLNGPLRPSPDDGASGILVPKSPAVLPEAGEHSFRLAAIGVATGDVPVRVALRRGPTRGRSLPLNVFVHELSGLGVDDVRPLVDRIRAILEPTGIDLTPVEVVTGGDASNAVIRGLGPGSNVESLFALPVPLENALTIYLVDDLRLGLGTGGTILGVSAGLPGSMGWPLPTDAGVLVSVAAHLDGRGRVDPAFLGTTMAHEGGHWLGLNHTSESAGNQFDPVPDTPECPASRDTNRNGQVDLRECPDGENLMFWTGVVNDALSPDQAELLSRAPIVRP